MSSLLKEKSALVLGAGGLGGPALLVLAGAGVGRLVLVEDGVVETSDLAWQPLYREADLGARRAAAARARLALLFPDLDVGALDQPLDEASAGTLFRQADAIVDGAPRFEDKFLASDAAVAARKPLVHGGLLRYSAQILTLTPGASGCLRCLFEGPPPRGAVPSVAEAGVLGPLAGLAGALMGAEALRLLAGERGSYAGRMMIYEARGARGRAVNVRPREGCPVCAAVRGPAAERGPA